MSGRRVVGSGDSKGGTSQRKPRRSVSSGESGLKPGGSKRASKGSANLPSAKRSVTRRAGSSSKSSNSRTGRSGGMARSLASGDGKSATRRKSNGRSRTVNRSSRPKGKPRSISSAESRRSRSAPGDFVDARKLEGEDLVFKTLSQTTNMLGVAARPKVVDFNARLKERKRAKTMVAVRKVAAIVVALVAVAALMWFMFFSPVFCLDAKQISVSGQNKWVGKEQIVSIAKKQSGKSLFLVSSNDVVKQLKSIPGVSQAKVQKKYPQGIRVSVVAQEPAAMLRTPNGDMAAVDGYGRVLNSVGNVSAQGIPVIEVNNVGSSLSNRAVQQAVRVLNQMPQQMRHSVTKVEAKTQDSVTTEINNGDRVIVWGDSSDMKLKKAVVDKISNDPSKIGDKHQIDVSAPLRPIIK